MNTAAIKDFLDEKADQYNQQRFVQDDPVCIPHQLSRKEDIEIMAFLVATIAWGNRKAIIKSGQQLLQLMRHQPLEFVLNYSSNRLSPFVYRTFNSVDLDFFFHSLKHIYHHHKGLEHVFPTNLAVKERILHFRTIFLSVPHAQRSEKHIANPEKGSSAKRINLFLRWMIRNDKRGVDFGIWPSHHARDLYVPLDVHTGIAARKLGLIQRKTNDWKALEELMHHLRLFCPEDPCKYDFALFGLSVNDEL